MPASSQTCFLNVPYDRKFERLFLSYVAGMAALGLTPRATLEIPGGARRLERILDLIKQSRYSVHDLSRVEIDRHPPRTPRFNMPFEAGLAVALDRRAQLPGTNCFFFEADARRLLKSLSDLNGADAYQHGNRIDGVFRELNNAFVGTNSFVRVSAGTMRKVYWDLRRNLPAILRHTGARSIFEASAFKQVVYVARASARSHV